MDRAYVGDRVAWQHQATCCLGAVVNTYYQGSATVAVVAVRGEDNWVREYSVDQLVHYFEVGAQVQLKAEPDKLFGSVVAYHGNTLEVVNTLGTRSQYFAHDFYPWPHASPDRPKKDWNIQCPRCKSPAYESCFSFECSSGCPR